MAEPIVALRRKFTLIIVLIAICLVGRSQKTLFYDDCNNLNNWSNTGKIYPAGMSGFNWLSVDPLLPSDDHTGGGKCLYTNGNSDYQEAQDGNYILYQIVSRAIDLSGYDQTRLEFWMQLRAETDNWDGGYIEWSHDSLTWTPFNSELCVAYDGNMSKNDASTPYYPNLWPSWWAFRTSWTRVLVNTSAVDNVSRFYLRFTFHSDELEKNKGWAIDDIRIVSISAARVEGNNIGIQQNNVPAMVENTDFGIVQVGQSVDKVFYIHNTGESPLTLTGTPPVTATGAGFSVIEQPQPNVIPPGDSVAFKVRFSPLSSVTTTGTLSIPTSDIYSKCTVPPILINVKGSAPNTPPLISGLRDTTLCPGASQTAFSFTLGDKEQSPASVGISATSSNQAIIANSSLVFSGSGTNRVLTITAVEGQTGTVNIIITADDQQQNNNIQRDTITVRVEDLVNPQAFCKNVQIQLNSSGSGSLTATEVDLGSTDNCSIASLSISQTEFNCADAGTKNLVFTVTDFGGNKAECKFITTILPPAGSVSLQAPLFPNGKNISCFGYDDGSIKAIPEGGCPPYTFSWELIPGLSEDEATGLKAGSYSVNVKDASGQEWVEEIFLTEPDPIKGTKTSVKICEKESASLVADSTAQFFEWSTGETSSAISVQDTGLYLVFVRVESADCPRLDSFHLAFKNCFVPLEMVNAFSPGGDGINEVFKAKQTYAYDDFSIQIYNRWGLLVFESEDPFFEWDGNSKGGNELPAGTYFYIARYLHKDQSDEQKAAVTLIR